MVSANEQRSRITHSDALARYLPAHVARHLLEDTLGERPAIDHEPYIAQLRDLLQLVVTYIPEYALAARSAPDAPRRGRVSQASGTLLSADLSGFTAFSARLGTLGSEGAELVARTMSALFGALFDTLGRWNGSVLKLSGDALTAIFSGPNHPRWAAAAALELQERMLAFEALETPVGPFTLRMRIGLASGAVLLTEVGTPDRIELLVAGAPARRAVEIQRVAAPGTVVVAGATYREIESTSRAFTVAPNIYHLTSIDPIKPPQPVVAPRWKPRSDRSWELQALVARLEQLRPYLVEQHLGRLSAGPQTLAGDGDIRPVTVLFACLANAGPLLERASQTQTESALDRLESNARRIWEIVTRHGGTINKLDLHSDGHTLVALFGAPVAYGNEADRAVSCALALLRECGLPDGNEAEGEAALLVRRVGLATGRVFAGAVGSATRREYTVMGSVVNLAARLMDLAVDGEALIDDRTAQAVGGRFRLQQRPPVPVKGYDEAIPLFLVASEQRSRLSALMRERTRLVGRDNELAQATTCVSNALAGSGCVVALVGEAGIGKSRLLAEIARSLPVPGPLIALVQAQPQTRNQPYALIVDLLRQLYDLPASAEQAALVLGDEVRRQTANQERFLPLLLAMMGLPTAENTITQALTPGERRDRLHALVVMLLSTGLPGPSAVLLLEDLHWVDPASFEILSMLSASCGHLPLALICTYRSEDGPQWPEDAPITLLTLRGLAPEQSQELLDCWMDGQALMPELRAAAVERTQGNPLFLAETARTLRERDPGTRTAPPLPSTVQSALLARLDRLSLEDRYVLRLASVIGARFERSILEGLVHTRVQLDRALRRLSEVGLVRAEAEDGDQYRFTHTLLQETAYESLLFAQRRELHRRVGDRLRVAVPERAEEEPGPLAFHYRRAEAWGEALEYSWRAGNRAQSLYAGSVALDHYQNALEAVERLSGAAAPHWRSTILQRCGDLHALAGRYQEAIETFGAALDAAHDDDQRAAILISWAETYEHQASYAEALALLDRAAEALGSRADDPLVLRVRVRQGWILARQGQVEEARAVVEPCLERLEAQEGWRELLLAYKVFCLIAISQSRWGEARVYSRLAIGCAERVGDVREIARISNNLSFVLTQEGKLREAAESCRQAASMMEQIGDQYNLGMIKGNTGVIYYKLGDFDTALDYYSQSLEIATAISAPLPESIVRNNLGEIYRQIGRLDESVEQIGRSIALCEQIDDDLGLAEGYRQLAETYLVLGQIDQAVAAGEKSFASAVAAGDPQAEAIAYRVRGLLAAAQGADEAALEASQRSIRMLSELGSTQELGQSMVTRATILMRRGHVDAARAMLEEAIVLFRKAGAAMDEAEAEQLLVDTHREQHPAVRSIALAPHG